MIDNNNYTTHLLLVLGHRQVSLTHEDTDITPGMDCSRDPPLVSIQYIVVPITTYLRLNVGSIA